MFGKKSLQRRRNKMTVSELIQELQTIENKNAIVYAVSGKEDYRKSSFNHRSTKVKSTHEFTGKDTGYEHMQGIFIEGETK